MPDTNVSAENYKKAAADNKPIWKPFVVIALLATIGLGVIWGLCLQFVPLEKDRVPAFIGLGVSYLILMAMFVQAYITQKQWKAMQDGLTKTQNLLEQNERMIEAANRQADSATAQSAMMRESIRLTEEAFYLSERAYVCIDDKPRMPNNWLDAEKTNRIELKLYNGGRTPAFNVRIRCFQYSTTDFLNETVEAEMRAGLNGTEPINTPRIILAGRPEPPIWVHTKQQLSKPDHAAWVAGKRNVFIAIDVSYEDVHRDTQSLIYWYQFFNYVGFALRRPLVLEVRKRKKNKQTDAS